MCALMTSWRDDDCHAGWPPLSLPPLRFRPSASRQAQQGRAGTNPPSGGWSCRRRHSPRHRTATAGTGGFAVPACIGPTARWPELVPQPVEFILGFTGVGETGLPGASPHGSATWARSPCTTPAPARPSPAATRLSGSWPICGPATTRTSTSTAPTPSTSTASWPSSTPTATGRCAPRRPLRLVLG